MFLQNFLKLNAAVYELPCSQSTMLNNTAFCFCWQVCYCYYIYCFVVCM